MVYTLYNDLGFKNVYGFDASNSGIEVARKNFPELAQNFFIHNAYESELPANVPQRYNLIISMEVLEHLYAPRNYLMNAYHWLESGGYLILTTPYHGYLKNIAISLFGFFDRHFNPLWEGGHIKFFSKHTIIKLLRETGFSVIKFKGVGRLPLLWKSMIVVAKKP